MDKQREISEEVLSAGNDSAELKEIFEQLKKDIPKRLKVNIQNAPSGRDKVERYNLRIIETYIASETQHLQQQKRVGVIISIAVGIQLIVFNILIYMVVLKNYDVRTRTLLLDFMKYYTGAVIVEMLGMCLLIIKSIYDKGIGKIIEHIIKRK